MTLTSAFGLFGFLALMAALPSVSSLTVAARAAAAGFVHGAATALGVVLGDVSFILLAIFGLSLLSTAMGEHAAVIGYLAAAFLIGLGIAVLFSGARNVEAMATRETSLLSSFSTGLLITLADQKAIGFYLGALPAFLDLSTLSSFDAAVILVVALVAVGGVKIGYAFAAGRVGLKLSTRARRILNIIAGTAMISAGLLGAANAAGIDWARS